MALSLEAKDMLEKHIETRVCNFAKDQGVAAYKFTSPNRAAVPDRLNLAMIPEEHREIVAKYVTFIEFKRHGQKPTPAQAREHQRLRELGFRVEVVDDVEYGKSVIKEMGQ